MTSNSRVAKPRQARRSSTVQQSDIEASAGVSMKNRRSIIAEKRGAATRSMTGRRNSNSVSPEVPVSVKRFRTSKGVSSHFVNREMEKTISESTEDVTTETESRPITDLIGDNSPLTNTPTRTSRDDIPEQNTLSQREMHARENISSRRNIAANDQVPSLPPPSPTPQNNSGRDGISLSLAERRRSRAITNIAEHVALPSDSPSGGMSTVNSPRQFNRMKAQLAEAVSEKRTMKAALDLANEKCVQQQKDNRRLLQQIHALEQMINKPSSKGRRSSKKGSWSNEDEKSVIAPYKGIKLQLDIIVNAEATLVVTESTFSTNGKVRLQDWTASASITEFNANNRPLPLLSVKLPDGSIAVPKCAMLRCFSKKFYNDRFHSTTAFVRHVTRKILEDSHSFGMSPEEKEDCIDKMSCYLPVLSKCRTALREETNNSKQGARNTFLKGLCYRKAPLGEEKRNKVENESRTKEKNMAFERIVRMLSGNELDTMYWRTTPYASLYNIDTNEQKTVEEMISIEQDSVSDGKVDNLFMNEPARLTFHRLRGYSISDDSQDECKDTSIIWLARADAWITTAMMNIRGVGRGGTHSNEFLQNYERLLPKALERIIKDIWEDVSDLAPQEVSRSVPGHEDDDPYGNKVREFTLVQKSSEDGYLYLVATPKYILENVCSWIGCVKDCQIGRCREADNKFIRITKDMDFRVMEESDLEDQNELDHEGTGRNMEIIEPTEAQNVNGFVTPTELPQESNETESVDEGDEFCDSE